MAGQSDTMLMRRAVVYAKVETEEGVDGINDLTPDDADAVLVEASSSLVNLDFAPVQTNEVTGSLDRSDTIPTGAKATVTISTLLRGSSTAGVAAPWGVLLRACGFSETITGTAVPSSAEVCGGAGTTTTATLGSSASGTANAYLGMPVNFTVAPVGTSFIRSYSAAKLATLTDTLGAGTDTATNYQILKNVRYTPTSVSADIPSLTIYIFMDGVLYKLTGCRGVPTFRFPTSDVAKIEFTFSGIFGSKVDQALPTPTYASSLQPPVFLNGTVSLDRSTIATSEIVISSDQTVTQPKDANKPEGFGTAIITDRKYSVDLDPMKALVATRDTIGRIRAGTTTHLHFRYGSTAGNRISVTMPGHLISTSNKDDNMALRETIKFESRGNDASALQICVW